MCTRPHAHTCEDAAELTTAAAAGPAMTSADSDQASNAIASGAYSLCTNATGTRSTHDGSTRVPAGGGDADAEGDGVDDAADEGVDVNDDGAEASVDSETLGVDAGPVHPVTSAAITESAITLARALDGLMARA
jgi:hypothetical protein